MVRREFVIEGGRRKEVVWELFCGRWAGVRVVQVESGLRATGLPSSQCAGTEEVLICSE